MNRDNTAAQLVGDRGESSELSIVSGHSVGLPEMSGTVIGSFRGQLLEIVIPGLVDRDVFRQATDGTRKPILAFLRALGESSYNNRPAGEASSEDTDVENVSFEITRTRGRKLAFFAGGAIQLADPSEICAIEAEGNYVRVHRGGSSTLLRDTISSVAKKLRPFGFLRIHRSVVVNSELVDRIEPLPNGDYSLIMKNDRRFTISRTYRSVLAEFAGATIGCEGPLRQFQANTKSNEPELS